MALETQFAIIAVIYVIVFCLMMVLVILGSYVCYRWYKQHTRNQEEEAHSAPEMEIEDTTNYRDSILFEDPPPTYRHSSEYPSIDDHSSTTTTPQVSRHVILPPESQSYTSQEATVPPPDYTSQVVELGATHSEDAPINRNVSEMQLAAVVETELSPPPEYTSQVLPIDILSTSRVADITSEPISLELEPMPPVNSLQDEAIDEPQRTETG